jgi:hypothetical protein
VYSKSNPRLSAVSPVRRYGFSPRPEHVPALRFRFCPFLTLWVFRFPGFFAHSFHSLHQECFTTLLQSSVSTLFLKNAGCHPTIPVLELVALGSPTLPLLSATDRLFFQVPDSFGLFCTLARPRGTSGIAPMARPPARWGALLPEATNDAFASVGTAESSGRHKVPMTEKSREGRARKEKPNKLRAQPPLGCCAL